MSVLSRKSRYTKLLPVGSAAGGVECRGKGGNAEIYRETAVFHRGNTSRSKIKVVRWIGYESTSDDRPTQIVLSFFSYLQKIDTKRVRLKKAVLHKSDAKRPVFKFCSGWKSSGFRTSVSSEAAAGRTMPLPVAVPP